MIPAVVERCAGIDVGKKLLLVCVVIGPAHQEGKAETRKFGTIRSELEKVRAWLKSEGCTHVVMESTGCYWKPVLNVLEDDPDYPLHIVLANPQQVKAVTGHKTDPHDAHWLAHLLRHGMVRPSFIPPRALRDLRDLTRRRKQIIGGASQERNRIQKLLEDANIKIGDVLSDVFGLSGQLMLEALLDGQVEPMAIAELAKGNARKKIAELAAALEGHQMRPVHRTLIRHAMEHMAFLARQVESLDDEIEGLVREAQFRDAHQLLQTIPGIQETAAATILAECGPDMKQFPQPENFSSWAGVAPGNNESAGVRKRAPAMKGNPHLKTALVESGWSASRTQGTEFKEQYERLRGRIGHKRAIVASAHLLALQIYQVLSSAQPYQPRSRQFKPREIRRLHRHHSRRLKWIDRWLKDKPLEA